jgi:hypothetical protein
LAGGSDAYVAAGGDDGDAPETEHAD